MKRFKKKSKSYVLKDEGVGNDDKKE